MKIWYWDYWWAEEENTQKYYQSYRRCLLDFWTYIPVPNVCDWWCAGTCARWWAPPSPTCWWRRPPCSPWWSPRPRSGECRVRLGTRDTASAIPRSALRTSLTPEEGIRRLRRSVPDIDLALKEAVQVEKVCSAQFPYCKISRIDILKWVGTRGLIYILKRLTMKWNSNKIIKW